MPKTVLVPLDGSPLAEAVLGPLCRKLLGPKEDSRLVLLRVVEPAGSGPTEIGDRLDVAEGYLLDLERRLRAQGYTCEHRELRGDPAEQIVHLAEELQPDLVTMSTHGRSGITRWLRGSVAERVLRSIRSPLLLLNPSCRAASEAGGGGACLRRVLVPLDGSPLADGILPHVESLARACGAAVTLLRVKPFAPAAIPSPLLQPDVWEPREVETSLEPQRTRLAEAGLEVNVHAAIGNPAAEIVRAAVEADLVAMTTHGRSGVSRWWFGSVAEQVIRHCDCPLLVVRAREEHVGAD